jgi:riboflavin biosynthesis pyrimidine reductase
MHGPTGIFRANLTPFSLQSLDGSIAAVRGAPLRLSGEASMALTHELRAMHDGIISHTAATV